MYIRCTELWLELCRKILLPSFLLNFIQKDEREYTFILHFKGKVYWENFACMQCDILEQILEQVLCFSLDHLVYRFYGFPHFYSVWKGDIMSGPGLSIISKWQNAHNDIMTQVLPLWTWSLTHIHRHGIYDMIWWCKSNHLFSNEDGHGRNSSQWTFSDGELLIRRLQNHVKNYAIIII